MAGAKDRRRRRNSIAGDGLSGPEVGPRGPFEPSISGCLTGDLGVPGYEPDGISWLPHPATSAHRATARRRPSVPIGPGRENLSGGPLTEISGSGRNTRGFPSL